MCEIKNMPKYANEHEFIVARNFENDLWFWGAFDSRREANDVAEKIEGVVIENAHFYKHKNK